MTPDEEVFGFPPSFASRAEGEFPAEDVEASLQDRDLQRRHRYAALPEGQRKYLEAVRSEAIERGASNKAHWIYFSSPEWTWKRLCGREGWMLYDEKAKRQYAFQLTVMN